MSEHLIDLSKVSFGLGGLLQPWFLYRVARTFQANGSKHDTASAFSPHLVDVMPMPTGRITSTHVLQQVIRLI